MTVWQGPGDDACPSHRGFIAMPGHFARHVRSNPDRESVAPEDLSERYGRVEDRGEARSMEVVLIHRYLLARSNDDRNETRTVRAFINELGADRALVGQIGHGVILSSGGSP